MIVFFLLFPQKADFAISKETIRIKFQSLFWWDVGVEGGGGMKYF